MRRLLVEDLLHLVRRQILAELLVDLVVASQQRLDRRDTLFDVPQDGLDGSSCGSCVQKSDRDPVGGKGFAEEALVLPGHDLAAASSCPRHSGPSTPIFAPK